MSSSDASPLSKPPVLTPPPRVLVVVAPFYTEIADMLTRGAQAVLDAAGAGVEIAEVPGALELPTAVRLASETRRFDGYVTLGCVIRGETTHYEIVSEESARGLGHLGAAHGLAIGNGVLTVETMAQALERADPARLNKGAGAALAALHLIALARRFGARAGAGRQPRQGSFDDPILLA